MSSPAEVFRAAVDRERQLVSGRVSLLVKCEAETQLQDLWPEAPEEVEDGLRLDIVWKGDFLFRIDIYRQDTVLRTIVCDGSHIDTGNGERWDLLLLTDPTSDKKWNRIHGLMWPLNVFRMHLFPLSLGLAHIDYRTFYFNRATRISALHRDPSRATQNERFMDIWFGPRNRAIDLHWEFTIDRESGYAVTRSQDMSSGRPAWEVSELSDPFLATDQLWVTEKLRCTYPDYGESGRAFTSAIIQEGSDFALQPRSSEFSISSESDNFERRIRHPDNLSLVAYLVSRVTEPEAVPSKILKGVLGALLGALASAGILWYRGKMNRATVATVSITCAVAAFLLGESRLFWSVLGVLDGFWVFEWWGA